MALTASDAAALYKQQVGDKLSDVTIYDSNPFLATLKNTKLSSLQGLGARIPVRTAPPPCVSGNLPTGNVGFDRLVTNSTTRGSTYKSFLMTHSKLLGIAHVETDQVLLSDSMAGAFAQIATGEKDGIVQHLTKQLEQILFDEGYGRIGRIKPGSSVAGATITLEDQCDGTNFEVGMEIVGAAAVATGAIRTVSTNGAFVESVTYTAAGNTATVTFTAAVNDSTDGISASIAAGDYLFVRNSRDPASSPVKSVPEGLGSHLPGTSTAHDTFYGVTRTANTRLKGLFVDGTAQSLVESLFLADQLAYSNGGKTDIAWCSPATFRQLQLELVGKINYNEASVSKVAGVNFKAIEFVGMSGNMIRVASSRGCSDRVMFLLTSSGWSYRTIHPGVVQVYNHDGNADWLRTTSDSMQVRVHSRGNLVGTAHGHNVRINL